MAAPMQHININVPLSRSAVAFLDLVAQRQGWSRENVIEAAIAGFIDDWRPFMEEAKGSDRCASENSRTGHAADVPPKPD